MRRSVALLLITMICITFLPAPARAESYSGKLDPILFIHGTAGGVLKFVPGKEPRWTIAGTTHTVQEAWPDATRLVLSGHDNVTPLELHANGIDSVYDHPFYATEPIGKVLHTDIYAGLLAWFKSLGLRQGQDYDVFAYDWLRVGWSRDEKGVDRRTIDRLREKVLELSGRNGGRDVILVSHSLGGLMAREYIVEHQGDRVKAHIGMATPYDGVFPTYQTLRWGWNFGIGTIDPKQVNRLAGNWPVAYRLLPLGWEGGHFIDEETWQGTMEHSGWYVWGPAVRNQKLFDEAKAWKQKLFNGQDYGVRQYNILGEGKPTARGFRLKANDQWEPILTEEGDNTVLLVSGSRREGLGNLETRVFRLGPKTCPKHPIFQFDIDLVVTCHEPGHVSIPNEKDAQKILLGLLEDEAGRRKPPLRREYPYNLQIDASFAAGKLQVGGMFHPGQLTLPRDGQGREIAGTVTYEVFRPRCAPWHVGDLLFPRQALARAERTVSARRLAAVTGTFPIAHAQLDIPAGGKETFTCNTQGYHSSRSLSLSSDLFEVVATHRVPEVMVDGRAVQYEAAPPRSLWVTRQRDPENRWVLYSDPGWEADQGRTVQARAEHDFYNETGGMVLWTSDANARKATFSRRFRLPWHPAPRGGSLTIAADDVARVYVNGKLAGEMRGHRRPETLGGLTFRKGENLVEVEVQNLGGHAAWAARLEVPIGRPYLSGERIIQPRVEGSAEAEFFFTLPGGEPLVGSDVTLGVGGKDYKGKTNAAGAVRLTLSDVPPVAWATYRIPRGEDHAGNASGFVMVFPPPARLELTGVRRVRRNVYQVDARLTRGDQPVANAELDIQFGAERTRAWTSEKGTTFAQFLVREPGQYPVYVALAGTLDYGQTVEPLLETASVEAEQPEPVQPMLEVFPSWPSRDEVDITVRLATAGARVAGETVAVRLLDREETVTTGEDGTARVRLKLPAAYGPHAVTVEHRPGQAYLKAATRTLQVNGTGPRPVPARAQVRAEVAWNEDASRFRIVGTLTRGAEPLAVVKVRLWHVSYEQVEVTTDADGRFAGPWWEALGLREQYWVLPDRVDVSVAGLPDGEAPPAQSLTAVKPERQASPPPPPPPRLYASGLSAQVPAFARAGDGPIAIPFAVALEGDEDEVQVTSTLGTVATPTIVLRRQRQGTVDLVPGGDWGEGKVTLTLGSEAVEQPILIGGRPHLAVTADRARLARGEPATLAVIVRNPLDFEMQDLALRLRLPTGLEAAGQSSWAAIRLAPGEEKRFLATVRLQDPGPGYLDAVAELTYGTASATLVATGRLGAALAGLSGRAVQRTGSGEFVAVPGRVLVNGKPSARVGEDGRFVVPLSESGLYEVRVEAAGFTPGTARSVYLGEAQVRDGRLVEVGDFYFVPLALLDRADAAAKALESHYPEAAQGVTAIANRLREEGAGPGDEEVLERLLLGIEIVLESEGLANRIFAAVEQEGWPNLVDLFGRYYQDLTRAHREAEKSDRALAQVVGSILAQVLGGINGFLVNPPAELDRAVRDQLHDIANQATALQLADTAPPAPARRPDRPYRAVTAEALAGLLREARDFDFGRSAGALPVLQQEVAAGAARRLPRWEEVQRPTAWADDVRWLFETSRSRDTSLLSREAAVSARAVQQAGDALSPLRSLQAPTWINQYLAPQAFTLAAGRFAHGMEFQTETEAAALRGEREIPVLQAAEWLEKLDTAFLVRLEGEGRLLATDPEGRQAGWTEGGEPVLEIPGALLTRRGKGLLLPALAEGEYRVEGAADGVGALVHSAPTFSGVPRLWQRLDIAPGGAARVTLALSELPPPVADRPSGGAALLDVIMLRSRIAGAQVQATQDGSDPGTAPERTFFQITAAQDTTLRAVAAAGGRLSPEATFFYETAGLNGKEMAPARVNEGYRPFTLRIPGKNLHGDSLYRIALRPYHSVQVALLATGVRVSPDGAALTGEVSAGLQAGRYEVRITQGEGYASGEVRADPPTIALGELMIEPFAVATVSPSTAAPGAAVTLEGWGFLPGVRAYLESADGRRTALNELERPGDTRLKGILPQDLAAGEYRVVAVSPDGAEAAWTATLQVLAEPAPPVEPAQPEPPPTDTGGDRQPPPADTGGDHEPPPADGGARHGPPPADSATVAAVSPAAITGPATLTITGSGFKPGAAVVLSGGGNNYRYSAGSVSPDQVTVFIGHLPPASTYTITIDQEGAWFQSAITVTVGVAAGGGPTITQVSPATPKLGDTLVVTGSGFQSGLDLNLIDSQGRWYGFSEPYVTVESTRISVKLPVGWHLEPGVYRIKVIQDGRGIDAPGSITIQH